MKSRGHTVLWARNGQEGIATALQEHPDLILLDIQLPIMDGYAVATCLREQHHLSEVPIVALTSYAMAGDRAKALAAGCSEYIEKPINPTTFADHIDALLAQNPHRSTEE